MTVQVNQLEDLYLVALRDYLLRPDEALLERAYGLGRQALADGRGVLDMATMHSQAIASVMTSAAAADDRERLAEAFEKFFVEALSPFEIAHRSFREANTVLHRLNDVLEDQARRIAYALHGEAAQLLASVHLALADVSTRVPGEQVKDIHAVRELLDQIEERIRRISHELRPTILDDLGLVPAIEFLSDGISQRWGISVTVRGSVGNGLPATIETALYRAVQEGLNNVARHAHAASVDVALSRSPKLISCLVRDDGDGFDPAAVAAASHGRRGLGLVEVRERMAALGGTLRVVPGVERGTDFLVEIPLEAVTWV